jgi:hypothetical protein
VGELAMDRAGRWRAEAATVRGAGAATLGLRVRAGAAGFASFTEPRRNGPPVMLSAALHTSTALGAVELHSAVWRHAPGAAGARSGGELRREFAAGSFTVGAEERHGAQGAARSSGAAEGFRQGWWSEWSAGTSPGGDAARPAARLTARQESWGERSWARRTVRAITTARIEVDGWAGSRVRLTQTIHRARSGENLYIAEPGSDRAVLRALAGRGERTRVEIGVPIAGGELGGGATLASSGTRRLETRWSLEWTRRARLRRAG